MSKVINPKFLGSAINSALRDFAEATEQEADQALRATTIDIWGRVLLATPIDKGIARGGWLIGKNVTESKGSKNKNKGDEYVRRKMPAKLFGTQLFLFNNLPYIEVLEFGGYPNPPENPSEPPKTKGGFSTQAPHGMVRINLVKFGRILRKNLKAAGL